MAVWWFSGSIPTFAIALQIIGVVLGLNVPVYNHFHNNNRFILVPKIASNRSTDIVSVQTLAERMTNRHGLRVLHQFQFGAWRALLVEVSKDDLLNQLTEDDDLHYIEGNHKISISDVLPKHILNRDEVVRLKKPPSAPGSSENDDRTSPTCYAQMASSLAWHLPRVSSREQPDYDGDPYLFTDIDSGRGVEVFIVDTGIRTTHEEFAGNAYHGYTAAGLRELEADRDGNGHGTNVASLVAGSGVGVAKQTTVIAVKVLDAEGIGDVSWILEGLQWVSERVVERRKRGESVKAVVNLSLGSPGISYSLDDAVRSLVRDLGVSVVVAAGNDYVDACGTSPGRSPDVITVSASTSRDELASFANFGGCVDLLAPGDSLMGAWGSDDSVYALVSGTSQATPLVSGVLARYLSSVVDLPTPEFLKSYLTDTASAGYITLVGTQERATPNRLVYRACDVLASDTPRYPYVSSGARVTLAHGLTYCMIVVFHMLTAPHK